MFELQNKVIQKPMLSAITGNLDKCKYINDNEKHMWNNTYNMLMRCNGMMPSNTILKMLVDDSDMFLEQRSNLF